MSRFTKRPSAGAVIATVALFVALGGVAGALPGTNTVNNGDVKDLKYKDLNLKNGWSGAFNAYTPGAALDAQGIVHLRGAISQGIDGSDNFGRLPSALRPGKDVYLVVDQTNGNQGRVLIQPSGEMFVFEEPGGPPTAAELFTSLDGASFEG